MKPNEETLWWTRLKNVMDKIDRFRGEYGWLSNFADVKIEYKGRTYNSVEHAYLSAKCDDAEWKQLCSENHPAGELKKLSKGIPIVPNWENQKITVMKQLLIKKYTQEPFKTKLINTKGKYIEEGNTWYDIFWGVDLKSGFGENYLGKIIMDIREILLKNNKS